MNRKSVRWSLASLLILASMLLASCRPRATPVATEVQVEPTAAPIKITYYSTSAEVQSMYEEMFVRYHELHPNVTVELIPTGVGQGQQEKLQSLYASGNAPTFMNIDPSVVLQYRDKLLPLSPDIAPWLNLLVPGAIEAGTIDGQILGIPWSIQGYGLNYNKRIVDEVYGGTFDPTTINTRDALRAFLEKINAAGTPATMIHGANWSVGAHYLGMVYAVHGPDTMDGVHFVESLQTGNAHIADDEIFNGYMDTFDLLMQYNYRKNDPLVGDYIADAQAYATGEVASYFMGDWLWSVIGGFEEKETEFGFIPVPWSNDPTDYGNTQIVVSMPKLMAIDASQNTPEQQQAALDLLEWMLTSPEGQEFHIQAGFAMPYSNVRQDAAYNSMTTSVADYVARGKTINIGCFLWVMTGDTWTKTGDLMLQYLAGAIDRAELAEGIDAYWQSVPPVHP